MFCAYTRPRYQVSVYMIIGPLVCCCTTRFMSDLFVNYGEKLSRDAIHSTVYSALSLMCIINGRHDRPQIKTIFTSVSKFDRTNGPCSKQFSLAAEK